MNESFFNNSTGNRHTISTIVELGIFTGAILGNLFVIGAVINTNKLQTTINYLIVNLSVCDVIIVISSIPFNIAARNNKGYGFGNTGCRLINPACTMATNSAVLALLFITFERYVAISHPLNWSTTRRFRRKIAVITHLYGLCTVVPYSLALKVIPNKHGVLECVETWSLGSAKAYTVFLFLVQYGLPLPLMIFCYAKAWFDLKQQNREVIMISELQRLSRGKSLCQERGFNLLNKCSTEDCSHYDEIKHMLGGCMGAFQRKTTKYLDLAKRRRRQNIRTFFMFVLVVFVFATCSLPNQITWLYKVFRPTSSPDLDKFTQTVFYWLQYSNSILNPFIYGGLSEAYRVGYRKICCCCADYASDVENAEEDATSLDMFKDGIITCTPIEYIVSGSIDSLYRNEMKAKKKRSSSSSNPLSILNVKARKLSEAVARNLQRKATLVVPDKQHKSTVHNLTVKKQSVSVMGDNNTFTTFDIRHTCDVTEKSKRKISNLFHKRPLSIIDPSGELLNLTSSSSGANTLNLLPPVHRKKSSTSKRLSLLKEPLRKISNNLQSTEGANRNRKQNVFARVINFGERRDVTDIDEASEAGYATDDHSNSENVVSRILVNNGEINLFFEQPDKLPEIIVTEIPEIVVTDYEDCLLEANIERRCVERADSLMGERKLKDQLKLSKETEV